MFSTRSESFLKLEMLRNECKERISTGSVSGCERGGEVGVLGACESGFDDVFNERDFGGETLSAKAAGALPRNDDDVGVSILFLLGMARGNEEDGEGEEGAAEVEEASGEVSDFLRCP